jgi:drug/metabolite transporter (DMT)-like permease
VLSEDRTRIRSVLRSCEPVAIGGPMPKLIPSVVVRHSTGHLALGFAAIYLIWGSTYLGIRYAIETIPPLVMMGIRHLTAGLLLYGWLRTRGTARPSLRHWGYAAVAGALFFLGSHGSLAWAEQRVPSGLAALLCATLPLWVVVLAWIRGTERNLAARTVVGLVFGFAGVALLIGPEGLRQSGNVDWFSASVVLMGSFLWAVGSIYTKHAKLPESTALSAAMQMISGGVILLLVGTLTGEVSRFHAGDVSFKSAAALAYLIVFGSIIAFSAFTWLMTASSPSRVSTYAYVNPVVAVLLGWALAGEPLGMRTIAAAGVILLGVVLVTTRGKPSALKKPLQAAPAETGD